MFEQDPRETCLFKEAESTQSLAIWLALRPFSSKLASQTVANRPSPTAGLSFDSSGVPKMQRTASHPRASHAARMLPFGSLLQSVSQLFSAGFVLVTEKISLFTAQYEEHLHIKSQANCIPKGDLAFSFLGREIVRDDQISPARHHLLRFIKTGPRIADRVVRKICRLPSNSPPSSPHLCCGTPRAPDPKSSPPLPPTPPPSQTTPSLQHHAS